MNQKPDMLETRSAAAQPSKTVFLTLLNADMYAALTLYAQPALALAAHLLLFSLVTLLGGVPEVRHGQSTPTGLISVICSFLLFGLGTLAALTRNRWLKPEVIEADKRASVRF